MPRAIRRPHSGRTLAAPSHATSVPTAPPRRGLSSWLLSQLANTPARTPGRSLFFVALITGAIGWLDFLTGRQVSLELFYFIPIVLAVAWLGAPAGCLVSAASIAIRVIGDLANGAYVNPGVAAWNRFTDLLVYLVLVWVMHGLISLYRELDRRVAERTHALEEAIRGRQRLERELLEIAARERSAVGRELHDDLGQQLVGTALAAKVLAENLAGRDPAAARDAQSIVRYVEEGIAKTRALARGLLLASIEPDELPNELAELAAKGSQGGVPCRFKLEGHPAIADAATAAQLFRIAQEALRNALRHAQPTHVDIVLAGNADSTFLLVKDDGRGLPPPAKRGRGVGLQIMEHRAALIGGRLSLVPAPGEGTRVICHLPRLGVSIV